MKTKKQELLFLFWIALLADCILIFLENEPYRFVTKPLLMPLLLGYFLVNTRGRRHVPSRVLVTIALVLAWVGDVFLMFEAKEAFYFMAGLISFLAMHIVYSIYFLRAVPLFSAKDKGSVLLPLVLVLAFDAFFIYKLSPHLADLKMPVIIYMAVISFMFVCAWNVSTNKRVSTIGVNFFIPAAIMFIFSDALLAFNKFILEEPLLGIAVMLTYGYAQHLLVNGFIRHLKGI